MEGLGGGENGGRGVSMRAGDSGEEEIPSCPGLARPLLSLGLTWLSSETLSTADCGEGEGRQGGKSEEGSANGRVGGMGGKSKGREAASCRQQNVRSTLSFPRLKTHRKESLGLLLGLLDVLVLGHSEK